MTFELVKEIFTFAGPMLTLIVGAYVFVYKGKATVQIDNETFLRSQILTKDDWQKLADKKDKEHEEEIKRINQAHEDKIRSLLQTQQFEKENQIRERELDKREIERLTRTVEDLQRQITANKP